MNIDRE
jgi:acyl transferase domain-containing protein